ncbi:hypothetical protein RHGRI_002514 [Rhododendron griersonianum]|uniref:ATP-dependent DNA helicase n=1 Tax=Rhododendron griersonianum TaxID=479676 RepID=A0AAV6LPV1_9ERIC|nr:hypothetical protein RHGRI_002514 [Rhododendron griersonianum]
MPISLRQLFCTILVHCNAMNPKQLFLKFEDSLKEDFAKRELMSDNEARQCLLQALKSELESMGRKLSDFGLHDLLHVSTETTTVYKEIQDEKNIRISEIDLQNSANLNKEQLIAFNDILEAVTFEKPMSFFIDGPGGTGKTFLYRSLLAVVRSQNLIALATATSGVAASILPNGRTAHSRFKIPIDGEGRLSCNDEASMAKRQSIEALDILLRDLTEKDYLFGGKVVVLGGDFRQVLPVIPKGTKDDCIDASLVRSSIWSTLKKHTLKENMRAKQDPAFSNFLLRIGNGIEPQNSKGEISIPSSMVIQPVPEKTPIQQLMDFAFPDLSRYSTDAISMTNSAILSPRNDTVDEINEELISKFPGEQHEYLSIDQTDNKAHQGLYIDFMHSVAPPGLPPHRLILKENCPMTSNMKMLKDIVPGVPNWTAEVMVIEKGLPRLAKNKRLYQKLVFIDSEGSKIQGTIFQQDMRFLKNTLKIYHTYRISNAIINDTPAQHQVIDNDHEWVLYARTPIEEVAVKELSITAFKYNFVPLADLTKYTKSREGIDAIFAVLKVGAPKKTKETWVQNILIIDQGSNFILIVTTTNLAAGVKLQTRGSTTFIFDPVLPEANALKTWCMIHSAAINKLPAIELQQVGLIKSLIPCRSQIIKINRLPTIVSTATLSEAARGKLGKGIEYAVHLRAYKYAPTDSEFCLFSIDTFVPVTKIIEDTQELHLVLQATTAQKNHYNKEGETKSPATQLRASYTAAQDAVATKASKTAIIEDATAPGKNSNNHHTSNNQ